MCIDPDDETPADFADFREPPSRSKPGDDVARRPDGQGAGKMQAFAAGVADGADAHPPASFRKKVDDIPVEIEAVIGRVRVSVAELMMAGPGHRFRLDRHFGEPIDLLVNGRLIGYGEIVTDRNDAAIGVRMIELAK
jgi:flagellar motor switch protein FliN